MSSAWYFLDLQTYSTFRMWNLTMNDSNNLRIAQTTVPNFLTIIRIALIPVVVGLFYFDRPLSNWIVAAIFVLACITDYLDGYFARTLKQTSSFGMFLDPVA